MSSKINIVYYTDPLCCWSWAMEPQWRKIQYEYRDHISIRYCMCGLLESWKTYNDLINSVSRPIQMGPLWTEAHHISGMQINDKIWVGSNAPASSYPACLAVKCAGLQSPFAASVMLRQLREAVMLEGENIASKGVIIAVAKKIASIYPQAFDHELFTQKLGSKECVDALRQDLQETRYRQIKRVPSVSFSCGDKGVLLTGFRPYATFKEIMQHFVNGSDVEENISEAAYREYWQSITARELLELHAVGNETTTQAGHQPGVL